MAVFLGEALDEGVVGRGAAGDDSAFGRFAGDLGEVAEVEQAIGPQEGAAKAALPQGTDEQRALRIEPLEDDGIGLLGCYLTRERTEFSRAPGDALSRED